LKSKYKIQCDHQSVQSEVGKLSSFSFSNFHHYYHDHYYHDIFFIFGPLAQSHKLQDIVKQNCDCKWHLLRVERSRKATTFSFEEQRRVTETGTRTPWAPIIIISSEENWSNSYVLQIAYCCL